MDAKGRVFIPAKYREGLGESFVVTSAFHTPCLWVFSQEAFESLSSKMEDFSLLDESTLSLERMLYNSACDVEPDKQGRVLLPQSLREYASLERDVIIAGSRNRLDIWDKATYLRYHDKDREAFDNSVDDLRRRGVRF